MVKVRARMVKVMVRVVKGLVRVVRGRSGQDVGQVASALVEEHLVQPREDGVAEAMVGGQPQQAHPAPGGPAGQGQLLHPGPWWVVQHLSR